MAGRALRDDLPINMKQPLPMTPILSHPSAGNETVSSVITVVKTDHTPIPHVETKRNPTASSVQSNFHVVVDIIVRFIELVGNGSLATEIHRQHEIIQYEPFDNRSNRYVDNAFRVIFTSSSVISHSLSLSEHSSHFIVVLVFVCALAVELILFNCLLSFSSHFAAAPAAYLNWCVRVRVGCRRVSFARWVSLLFTRCSRENAREFIFLSCCHMYMPLIVYTTFLENIYLEWLSILFIVVYILYFLSLHFSRFWKDSFNISIWKIKLEGSFSNPSEISGCYW